MRILLISDVHANPWVLHAALAAAGLVKRFLVVHAARTQEINRA